MSGPTPHPDQYPTIYPNDPATRPQFAEPPTSVSPDTSKLIGNFLGTTIGKVTALLGAAAVGAGVVGGVVYATSGDKVPEKQAIEAPRIPGDTNGDGFLSKAELGKMSLNAVAEVDPKLLVAAYGPDFDAWRASTLQIQINHNTLTAEELSVLGKPENLPKGPKADYSDQDVLNQVALDIADASIQEDLSIGQRMLPLPLSPDANAFSRTIELIKPNNGPVLDLYRQIGGSLPHPQGSFNGVGLSEYAQARLIHQEHMVNNGSGQSFIEYGLYGLVKNSNQEQWQLLRRWTMNDSGFPAALNALKAAATQPR